MHGRYTGIDEDRVAAMQMAWQPRSFPGSFSPYKRESSWVETIHHFTVRGAAGPCGGNNNCGG